MSNHGLFCSSARSPTVPTIVKKDFWIAGIRDFPVSTRNPWDFYQAFLRLGPDNFLVLSNDTKEVRIVKLYRVASSKHPIQFPLLGIRHPNFVDIYEGYRFKHENTAVIDYVGFSLEDLIQHSIYPTEVEIAYIISQVLAGVRFIWSRKLAHPRISTRNILISPTGKVKIDQTDFPTNSEDTSVNMNCLRTVMLRIMNENEASFNSSTEDWSDDVLDFMKATESATPYELSDHIFLNGPQRRAILTPLCTLTHLQNARRAAGQRGRVMDDAQPSVL